MSMPEDCWFCDGKQKVEVLSATKQATITVDCPVCKGVGEVMACV